MSLDATANFAKLTASAQSSADVTVTFTSADYAKLPAFPINLTWWNITDYADPSDDPSVEIVRATSGNPSTYVISITRAQEGTSAANHNTAGKIYKMIVGATSKTISDIASLLSTLNTFRLSAMGSVNGTNLAFVFTQEPTFIVSDGAWYTVGKGWTWNSGILTATMSIPPNTDLYGIA